MKDLIKDFPPQKHHQIEVFDHPKFGKVRVIMIDGNPWFVAVDICRALDIKNPTMAMKQLDDDERAKFNLGLPYGEVNIINEPGFYRLVFSSRKEEALEFQRWVYHEVLPAIRKYGEYSLVAPVVDKPKKNLRRVAGQKAHASVYIFRMPDGNVFIVKIGQSKDVETRKKQIEKAYNVTVTTYYKTCEFPRKVARAFEQACHRIFAPFKVRGELFAVEYETALRIVAAVEGLLKACPILFAEERAETLLNIATKIETLAATQSAEKALLVEAANIIAGKELVGVVGDIFLPASK